jgi:hypothetical protein
MKAVFQHGEMADAFIYRLTLDAELEIASKHIGPDETADVCRRYVIIKISVVAGAMSIDSRMDGRNDVIGMHQLAKFDLNGRAGCFEGFYEDEFEFVTDQHVCPTILSGET